MSYEITREDIEYILRILRAHVEERPDLRFFLENVPDDLDEVQLSAPHAATIVTYPGFELTNQTEPGADINREKAELTSPYPFVLADSSVETTLARPVRAVRRSALQSAIDLFKELNADNAAAYAEGRITALEWHERFRRDIKGVHVTAGVAGKGGEWANMTQADWGRIGQRVRQQYGFADNFFRELSDRASSGRPMTEAEIRSRMNLYAENATATFEAQELAEVGVNPAVLRYMPGDGTTECMCIVSPGSRVRTRAGLVPIGDLTRDDEVLSHRLVYRRVSEVVRKPSDETHRLVAVRVPGGAWILATQTHRWREARRWKGAEDLSRITSWGLDGFADNEILRGIIMPEQQAALLSEVAAGNGAGSDAAFEGILGGALDVAEVRFGGPLPPGTPLYDISVEYDHSYILEGAVSHNTNCKCRWVIRIIKKDRGDFVARWALGRSEHCRTCLARARAWRRIEVRGGQLVEPMEPIVR